MTPKGKLLIIGGHEEKIFTGEADSPLRKELNQPHFEILGALIDRTPHTHNTIEIIASASSIPEEMEQTYINAYKGAGYKYVGIIHMEDPAAANDEAFVKRIHYAHAVLFTGGDQRKLTQALIGTKVLEAIRKKYLADPNFMVAGTSAGAMSLSKVIIERGIVQEALLKNDLETGTGFGLLEQVIIDTHFIRRGRFGRLAHAVALYQPEHLTGIGLGEDGALLITAGNEAECLGSGMVIIIDGSDISATNVRDADDSTPIAIGQLKVHILAEGCKYFIKEKIFRMSDPDTRRKVSGNPSGKA